MKKVSFALKVTGAVLGTAVLMAVPIVSNVILSNPNIAGAITAELCPPITFNEKETNVSGQQLSSDIVSEGAVLLKNKNNCLPFSQDNKKLNIFGYSSVNWLFGGSGSGQVRPENQDVSTRINIVKAFKNYGIDVNTSLTGV